MVRRRCTPRRKVAGQHCDGDEHGGHDRERECIDRLDPEKQIVEQPREQKCGNLSTGTTSSR
jgi:hypothetical protein